MRPVLSIKRITYIKSVKECYLNIEVIEITAKQDPIVNDIIKAVGAEYGAVGEGYGPSDPEVFLINI